MNIQDLQELLKSLETAKELSMASIANEVQKLKDDKDSLKKDLENVLLQIVDRVDSIPLNEEIGKLNDKLRGEISKLNEASEKKIKSIEDNIKKITADLIIQIESKIPETIKETIIEKVNEVKLDESPEEIAKKLNTLESAIDAKVIKGLEDSIDASKIKNLKSLLPKNPPMYGGGSGASFIKSMRDVNLTGLTKDSEGKYLLGSGSGGSSTFLDLTDTPSAYTGEALKVVRVNAGETALEFVTLAGGGDALTTDPLSQFASTTSAELAGVISDETGTGLLVFNDSPTIVTPTIGTINSLVTGSDAGNILSANVTGNHELSLTNSNTGGSTVSTFIMRQGGNSRFQIRYSRSTLDTVLSTFASSSDLVFSPNSTEVLRVAPAGLTITGTLNTHTIPGGTGTLALTSDILSPAGSGGDYQFNNGSGGFNALGHMYVDIAGDGFTKLQDSRIQFVDRDDTSRQMEFDLTAITTATKRTLAIQDKNGTLATIDNETFTTRINVPDVRATNSGGLLLEASNGTDIGLLGAGNTANVTWYGTHNFDLLTASKVAVIGASKSLSSDTGSDLTVSSGAISVVSASTTTAGKVELAIDTEVNTGTDATRAVTPDSLAGSVFGTKEVIIPVFLYDYAVTTGDGKVYVTLPSTLNGMNLVDVRANLGVAPSTSGTPTIQIARGRRASATSALSFVDVLSTRITIDANEYDSKDATTSAVIDTANDDIATGDVYRIDIDVAGTGTKGLDIICLFRLP